MTGDADAPAITIHRLIEEARIPQRADRDANGTLPIRAARYCDAVTAACAFGWYLFPPIDLSFMWDGSSVLWTFGEHTDWMEIETAQFPGFAARFDELLLAWREAHPRHFWLHCRSRE